MIQEKVIKNLLLLEVGVAKMSQVQIPNSDHCIWWAPWGWEHDSHQQREASCHSGGCCSLGREDSSPEQTRRWWGRRGRERLLSFWLQIDFNQKQSNVDWLLEQVVAQFIVIMLCKCLISHTFWGMWCLLRITIYDYALYLFKRTYVLCFERI